MITAQPILKRSIRILTKVHVPEDTMFCVFHLRAMLIVYFFDIDRWSQYNF